MPPQTSALYSRDTPLTYSQSPHANDGRHLIDALPEEQVEQVLADVRRRTEAHVVPGADACAWIGGGRAQNGVMDLSTSPAHLAGFGHTWQ